MKSSKSDFGAADYQKLFWKSAVRQLPHHLALEISGRLRFTPLVSNLNRTPEKHLHASLLKTYPKPQLEAYLRVSSQARLWHGTGRYQYVNEHVTDTLSAILRSHSLNPVRDAYAVLLGGKEMVSISTTPLRIIARCYADTHGKGVHEANRYGSSIWWVAYYYSRFYSVAFARHGIPMIKNWSKWSRATATDRGERAWGKKVNKDALTVWDVFGLGSDIEGNYPILFGIISFGKTAHLPKVFARAEVRLTESIKLGDLSHIEVPEAKLAETNALIKKTGLSIPVFPIELGEYAASQQQFSSLLGLNYSRSKSS